MYYKPIEFFAGIIASVLDSKFCSGFLAIFCWVLGVGLFFVGFCLVLVGWFLWFVWFGFFGVGFFFSLFCDIYRSKFIFVALYITLLGSSAICCRAGMSKNCQQKEQGIGFGTFTNCRYTFNFKAGRSHLLQS